MSSKIYRRITIFIISIAVSGLTLRLAIKEVSPREFFNELTHISPLALFITSLFITAGLLLRATRWLLLSGFTYSRLMPFIKATIIGSFCNFTLPLRIGEIIKIPILKSNLPILSTNTIIASVVVDRALDFINIFSGCLLLAFFMPPEGIFLKISGFSLMLTAALFISLGIVKSGRNIFSSMLKRWELIFLSNLISSDKISKKINSFENELNVVFEISE